MRENGLTKTANLLRNPYGVSPIRGGTILRKLDIDFNIWLAPCGETPNFRNPSSMSDGRLESTAGAGLNRLEAQPSGATFSRNGGRNNIP
jgi:hypothetical protein